MIDLQEVAKKKKRITERSCVPLAQFPPLVTAYKYKIKKKN